MTNPEAIKHLSQHIAWRRDDTGTIEYVPFRLVKQAIELSGYTSDIIQNYIDYVSGKDRWRGGAVSVGVELERCLERLKEYRTPQAVTDYMKKDELNTIIANPPYDKNKIR